MSSRDLGLSLLEAAGCWHPLPWGKMYLSGDGRGAPVCSATWFSYLQQESLHPSQEQAPGNRSPPGSTLHLEPVLELVLPPTVTW